MGRLVQGMAQDRANPSTAGNAFSISLAVGPAHVSIALTFTRMQTKAEKVEVAARGAADEARKAYTALRLLLSR